MTEDRYQFIHRNSDAYNNRLINTREQMEFNEYQREHHPNEVPMY